MFRKVRPDWYISQVKEKRNHHWSIQDLTRVYSLRVLPEEGQKVPVDEVARLLSTKERTVTTIDVRNLTRMSYCVLLNRCFKCKSPLTDKDKETHKPGRLLHLCSRCKKETTDYKRKIRLKYEKSGLCSVCGQQPHLPGRKTCQNCISISLRRRNKVGLCGCCGKRPIAKGSIVQCKVCMKKNREAQAIHKAMPVMS